MTVHNSQVRIDVYQKLLDVSETIHRGIQSNEGASPLPKEQQKLVLDILSEVDISKTELRKHLIGRITAHPKITYVVLRTLSSKDALDADQLKLNQELVRSRIDELADLYRPYMKSRPIFDWLNKYGTCFDKTSLSLIPMDDLYQLTGLMHMIDGLGNSATILENLPEQGKQYRQLLHLEPSDFWQQVCQIDHPLSQDNFITFANYVSLMRVSYNELQTFLSQDDLSKLIPHLRYLRLHNVSDDIITKTLQTATKAEHVEVFSSTIQTLPDLAHCKFLDCHKCISLIQLPTLPSCQTLNCSECTKLITLPELPNCTALDCHSNPSLEKLPLLPSCEELNCSNCNKLAQLPELLNCKTLHCQNNPSLESLPLLPACEKLYCDECTKLVALPELPSCKILDCDNNPSLEKLSLLPKCEELNCSNCSKLVSLPELSNCKKLHSENNRSLESLPSLPSCEELNCSNCSKLVALPELPNCVSLNCSSCIRLTTFPQELPICETLNCSSCTSLRIIPQELPNCIEFNYENCSLSTIPALPQNTESRSGITTLYVDLNELASNPRKVLLKLDKHLSQHSFPLVNYQINGRLSEGIDAGGVGRDFISRLMESLFDTTTNDSTPSGKLDRNPQNYPQMQQKKDAQCYRAIGKVFAVCYSLGSNYKIGPIFHTDVYKKLALLATPSLGEIDVTSDVNIVPVYIQYRGDDFAGFSTLIDTSNNNIDGLSDNALMSAYDMTSDEFYSDRQQTLEHFKNKENREKLRSAVLQAAQQDPQFQAIRLITQELKNKLNARDWITLQQKDGQAIQDRIEGVLSKTAIINNFCWKPLPSIAMQDPEENSEQNKALENKTKGYLHNWIERASIEELRTFVRAVTSNNALGPEKLVIELYKRGDKQLPIAHTCSFTLELSVEYPDQKTFDEKLTMFLSEALAGTGFQFA